MKEYYCYLERISGKFRAIEVKDKNNDYDNNPFIAISIGYIEADSIKETEEKSREIIKSRFNKIFG